ncbi:MAG: sulfotransferase family protein [Methyloligellaceae bacterium]
MQDLDTGGATSKLRFWTAFKRQRYAGWALYFWHGMRTRTWFNLLRRNGFRTTLTCLPNVISVSLLAPWNSLLFRLSELVFARRLRGLELDEPPIFVIGHWRAGTTYIHDLLACDPELSAPTTYQCFFPSHFLLTGPLARFWFNLFQPKTRPQDNVAVGFDRPQEDEFALCNLGLRSVYMTWALPRQGPVDLDYLSLRDLSPAERRTWVEGFLWFLRRVAYRQKKRLVLKSPQHTARLRMLIELFPEARFIHIARNPLTLFPSTIRLWKSMNSIQGLENPPNDDPWLEPFLIDLFMEMFRFYEEDRPLIPEGQLIEITYEDLVTDPKAELRRIYEHLNLGDFARTEAAVDGYLAGVKDYKTNEYQLPPEKRALILERWAPYIDRFGYRQAVERTPERADANGGRSG